MKNKDVSKKYAVIAILIALIVVGSALWMVQNNNLKSRQSDASAINRNIICYPNDIVTVTNPSSGQGYAVGEKVEISWNQLKVEKPVKVWIMTAAFRNPDDFGHCNSSASGGYEIASNIVSVEGRNTYTWTIPDDYPDSGMGDNIGIILGTDYNITTDQPGLIQASRDYSDGVFSIFRGKK